MEDQTNSWHVLARQASGMRSARLLEPTVKCMSSLLRATDNVDTYFDLIGDLQNKKFVYQLIEVILERIAIRRIG